MCCLLFIQVRPGKSLWFIYSSIHNFAIIENLYYYVHISELKHANAHTRTSFDFQDNALRGGTHNYTPQVNSKGKK